MAKAAFRWTARAASMAFLVLGLIIASGFGGADRYAHSLWVRWLSNGVDGQVNFYGRVIDQNGMPVENVDIRVELAKFRFSLPGTPWRVMEFHLKTDPQGYFKIVDGSGQRLSFYEFKKSGYEYLIPNERTSFNFEQNTTGIFIPNPGLPVIYNMRKKSEETYIKFNENLTCFDYERKESGMQKGFDLIIGNSIEERQFDRPMIGDIPLTCDIKIKAYYNTDANQWKLQMWPGNPEGGIIVSREKWYVAPVDGYSESYTIDPDAFSKEFNLTPINNPWTPSYGEAYVYLKSRTPPIYTRFCISTFRTGEHWLDTSAGGSVTNPYGDRDLEAATDLPWEVRAKLDQEVRDCYIHGRRPIKPDLPKLIQDEKGK